MPKLKTHRGTAKRIKITVTGKIKRLKAGNIHFNEKKNPSRKRSLAGKASIKGALAKNLKRSLGE